MILTQAPLRVSFVGGGTDLAEFYQHRPGRVISAAINKYVYVLVNPTPLIDQYTVKYAKTELVTRVEDLEHTRVRAALLDLGITTGGLEIGSFADLPSKTGLGSSSSFSVALLSCLHTYRAQRVTSQSLAEAASRLEIDILGEPIGKQDQYAAAFGGVHIYQFNPDGSVEVEPVAVPTMHIRDLEACSILFYTGLTRHASSVLSEQKKNTTAKREVLSRMADSVSEFARLMQNGKIADMGVMLHEGWLLKKSLASGISSQIIDELYDAGCAEGAWGGKVLGAGGGGCLLFLAPKAKREAISVKLSAIAARNELEGYREVPITYGEPGCKILVNNLRPLHLI